MNSDLRDALRRKKFSFISEKVLHDDEQRRKAEKIPMSERRRLRLKELGRDK